MMGIFSPLNCSGFCMQLSLIHCHWLATVWENMAKFFTHQVTLRYPSKMEKMKVDLSDILKEEKQRKVFLFFRTDLEG